MSPLSLLLLVICHNQSAFLISEKPLAWFYQQLEGWLAGLALPEHHPRLPTGHYQNKLETTLSLRQAWCLLNQPWAPLPRIGETELGFQDIDQGRKMPLAC